MAQRTLVRNTTYLTAALTVQKILSFVYFWFVSNNLFPNQLGQYVFALSYTSLFSILMDLGFSPILTREASKHDDQSNHILTNVISLKIPLVIITFILSCLFITLSNRSYEIKVLVYLASIIIALEAFAKSFWVIFRAKHNLRYESIGVVVVQIIIFSLGLWGLFTTGLVINLVLALLAASVFNFIYPFLLLKFKLKFSLKPTWDKDTIIKLLKIMPAFALAGIFIQIYNTSDSVLLGFLAGDAAVGFYSIPAKVMTSFQQIIPVAFAAVIFPAFSYYYAHDKKQLVQTFTKAFRYLTVISLPLGVGLAILAKPIILAFWPEYLPSLATFRLMVLAIPFMFLAFPTGYLLNACDRQKNNTINRGFIAITALGLNLVMIPLFSYFGASITQISTSALLLFLDFWWVGQTISVEWAKIFSILFKTLFSVAVMSMAIIFLLPLFNVFIAALGAALIYFVVLYLIKGYRLSEFKFNK